MRRACNKRDFSRHILDRPRSGRAALRARRDGGVRTATIRSVSGAPRNCRGRIDVVTRPPDANSAPNSARHILVKILDSIDNRPSQQVSRFDRRSKIPSPVSGIDEPGGVATSAHARLRVAGFFSDHPTSKRQAKDHRGVKARRAGRIARRRFEFARKSRSCVSMKSISLAFQSGRRRFLKTAGDAVRM